MTVRTRILTALNAAAALVWTLLFLERTSWGRSRFSDYGSALGPVALFFLIPAALAVVWWLGRKRPEPQSRWRRGYRLASAAFLGLSWAASILPVIIWAGLFGHVMSERWPFSAREGPDTVFARARFQEHFGFPPAGVDRLYCRRSWEFGDGNTYRMKFRFQDPAVIESIVRVAGLQPLPAGDSASAWVAESDPPGWWPKQRPGSAQGFHRSSRPRLWVDREARVACYRSWP